MEKGKHERRKVQIFEKYSVLILIATLLMSIGYAEITGIDMQVATNVETTAQKGVFITDITRTEYSGADISLSKINSYLDTTVNSTVVLRK